jgi:hypothetical protein
LQKWGTQLRAATSSLLKNNAIKTHPTQKQNTKTNQTKQARTS